MSRLLLGSLLGLAAGAVSVATMIPMTFPTSVRRSWAFCGRFSIGFFAGCSSLPDAILTKACAPIPIMVVIYGSPIGWALKVWG